MQRRDDDEEVPLEWGRVPHASLRRFTIVFRWDVWPPIERVDALLNPGEQFEFFTRVDSAGTSPGEAWQREDYCGDMGHVVELERVSPRPSAPAYVRVTFDVDELLVERSPKTMQGLAQVAQRVVQKLVWELDAMPIGFEP